MGVWREGDGILVRTGTHSFETDGVGRVISRGIENLRLFELVCEAGFCTVTCCARG